MIDIIPTAVTPETDLPTGYCHNCKQDQKIYTRLVGQLHIWKCLECGMWLRCAECYGVKTFGHVCACESREEVNNT